MCVPQPYITGGDSTVEVEATNTSPVPVLPKIGPTVPVSKQPVLPKIGAVKGKK